MKRVILGILVLMFSGSVAAPQERSTWVALAGVAASVPGALGGVVSGGAGVVAVAVFE